MSLAEGLQPLAPGTQIGRWIIGPPLGERGGQGRVYLATGGAASFALKIIDPLVWARYSQELIVEIGHLFDLDHPHITRPLERFEATVGGLNTQVLVMELADENLEEWVERSRRSTGQILDAGSQIADALTYLHEPPRGLIHNDVKPRNILRFGDVWKIGDFGVATVLEGTSAVQEVMDRQFAPPERAQKGRATPAGDIYSLGLSMLWANSQEPFENGQVSRRQTRGLDPRDRRLLLRCVSPDERNRPTARELAKKLPRLPVGSGTVAPPPNTRPESAAPRPAASRHRGVRRVIAGLLIALVAGSLALVVAHDENRWPWGTGPLGKAHAPSHNPRERKPPDETSTVPPSTSTTTTAPAPPPPVRVVQDYPASHIAVYQGSEPGQVCAIGFTDFLGTDPPGRVRSLMWDGDATTPVPSTPSPYLKLTPRSTAAGGSGGWDGWVACSEWPKLTTTRWILQTANNNGYLATEAVDVDPPFFTLPSAEQYAADKAAFNREDLTPARAHTVS